MLRLVSWQRLVNLNSRKDVRSKRSASRGGGGEGEAQDEAAALDVPPLLRHWSVCRLLERVSIAAALHSVALKVTMTVRLLPVWWKDHFVCTCPA